MRLCMNSFLQNWQLAWPEGDEMARRPLHPHTIIFIWPSASAANPSGFV